MEFFSKDLSPKALVHVLFMGFVVLGGELYYLLIRLISSKEKAATFREKQLTARIQRFFPAQTGTSASV